MMVRAMIAVALVVGAVGCTKRNPLYCDVPDDCASGFCDVEIHTCVENPAARMAAIELWVSADARLAAEWSPAFDPQNGSYEVEVGLALQSIRVTAVPEDPTTTITIDEVPTAAGVLSAPIALGLGSNVITVIGTSAAGANTVYTVDITRASQLAQEVYAKASNTDADDRFATSVALSGDTLAVGAPQEDSSASGVGGDEADDTAPESGAVYVFAWTGTTWSPQAYVKASNPEAGDDFGGSVALSGDTLVVGARYEDSNASGVGGNQADNTAVDSGAVYVFTRSGATWSQQAYVKASNSGAGDQFGRTLAITGDTMAIGAIAEDSSARGVGGDQGDNSAANSGAVYVFTRTSSTWSQQAYVKASNADAGDVFGAAVALSGETLAVSASSEDSAATGIAGNQMDNSAANSGAVYVFTRSGSTWSQQAYVKASNTEGNDLFGYSLALSGDTLAVGTYSEDSSATGVGGNQADNNAVGSGAVYVFGRTGATWAQEAYVKASNTEVADAFGISVALSGDILAVGARNEGSSSTGVGGIQADNSAPASGAVYLFSRTGGVWSQQAYIKASNTETDDSFGGAVALSGDTLAVGASGESSSGTGVGAPETDNGATASGAVYLFQ